MSIIKTKTTKKENRGGKRPNAGRKATGLAKEWTTISVKKTTKTFLNLIKKEKKIKNLDSLFLALIQNFKDLK